LNNPFRHIKYANILVIVLLSLITFSDPMKVSSAGDVRTDAVVLVNQNSSSYLDFQHYIQPYLDHFGVPYTILDISSEAVGVDNHHRSPAA